MEATLSALGAMTQCALGGIHHMTMQNKTFQHGV